MRQDEKRLDETKQNWMRWDETRQQDQTRLDETTSDEETKILKDKKKKI